MKPSEAGATFSVAAQTDALVVDGTHIARELRGLTDAGAEAPETETGARLLEEAREWMAREEAFRARTGLKLGLRAMEHFEEAAFLASGSAPQPDWRRLAILKVEFRVERLRKLR